MKHLLNLSSDDFFFERTARGQMICNGIPGLSLVMFYGKKCKNCAVVLPEFRKLPEIMSGCEFGIIDIVAHSAIYTRSLDSDLPITNVPFMLLFYNGKPYMQYRHIMTARNIHQFLIDVSKQIPATIPSKQTRSAKRPSARNHATPVGFSMLNARDATTGIPVFGDDSDQVTYIKYLQYDDFA